MGSPTAQRRTRSCSSTAPGRSSSCSRPITYSGTAALAAAAEYRRRRGSTEGFRRLLRGAMAVRELARRSGRDVKRVHEDVQVLAELGLVERDAAGGVQCPFADVHIDMHVRHESVAA